MAMDTDTIPNLLQDQRDNAPADLQHYYLQFEDYWERKLWHELTESLIEYFNHPQSAPQRIPLYDTFVKSFAEKINQLKLVTLGLSAASQCKTDQDRLSYVQSIATKVNKPSSQDAFVYATVAVASIYLELNDLQASRKLLDESETILDSFDSVETVVHASFYRVNADYYKRKEDFTGYYRTALLYLACINLDDLSKEEKHSRAYDLAIAALVSDTIYNFGELLLHPILSSLEKTEHDWLRQLLFSFNRGDLSAYDILSANTAKNPLLKSHQQFLYMKISLSALTETIFRRPPHNRTMRFSEIGRETKVPEKEIEHLVMKALSLGLVRGSIDQVAEVARINWVQPKVLDKSQIEGMRVRLKEWDASVNSLGNWIEGVGKDVWAA